MAERNTDTVPAMLTPGEFVITDKAVKKAGGPGFFYWLMNALDPSSKKASEDGYKFGGSVPDSLLSRMQEGGYTIPAGKNIFGQPTEEMGPEELMEMIMPGGGAKATLQMGKGGIKAILSSNKEDILKSLAKMRKTGKGSKEIAEAVDWQTELQKYLKQATSRRFTNPIKKQRGGSIDDYSLMDYMMPAMDKRLGPSLKKFQYGGGVPSNPNDPKYTHYMTQMALSQSGAQTGAMPQPSAQSQLIQPSNIYSTGIGSIFGEMGLQTPGSEYLENVQAYDPTEQRRMQQDLSMKMPGPTESAGGFAGSGAAIKKAGEEREAVTQQYTRGAEDLRKQYREQIMQDVLADMSAGTYEFEDLG